MSRFFRYVAPLLMWMGVIFFFSNRSTAHVITDDTTLRFIIFKSFHIIEYAILYVLAHRAVKQDKKRLSIPELLLSVLICVVFACSDEVHQSFIPGRTPALRDVGIDTIGIGGAYWLITRYLSIRI